MPIADPEKRREYQRIWAQKNRTTIPEEFKFKPKKATWEQLMGVENTANSLSTWKECIDETKKLLGNRMVNRVGVAMFALRACKIKQGGDVRSNNFVKDSQMNLKEFAKEAGINDRTLSDWIHITRRIVMKLPEGCTEVDFHAAKMALDKGRDASDDTLMERYNEFTDDTKPMRDVEYFLRGVRGVNRALSVGGWGVVRALTERETKAVEIMLGFCDIYFKDIKHASVKEVETATEDTHYQSRSRGSYEAVESSQVERPSQAAKELERMGLTYKNPGDIPAGLRKYVKPEATT